MFGAEFANDCPLAAWGHQSRVYHAVSDNATGPFTRIGVAVETESHNPVMTRDPVDGTWLLFTMGCPFDNSKDQSCAKFNVSCGVNGIGAYWTTTVYSSMSLDGPWEPHVDLLGNLTLGWFSGSQNVSPMFNPNGSIVLMFKGTNKVAENPAGQATPANIATAPHWRGPYTLLKYDIFDRYVKEDIVTEDCFMWRQPVGTYQALCHRGKSSGGGHWKTPLVGGHAFARTLDGNWTYSTTPSYTTETALISGGSLTIGRRERPQVFFGPDGTPSVLTNAVQPNPRGTAGLSFTFAQKLGGPHSPPSPPPPPPVCDPATFMQDTEFDDGKGLGEVHAATAAACCAECDEKEWAAKGCKWFSFVGASSMCFLKADDHRPLSRNGVTSGTTTLRTPLAPLKSDDGAASVAPLSAGLPTGPRAPTVTPQRPKPFWSWDRIPTSFQGSQKEREFNDAEVQRLAKYQMFTPEKWYTPCASQGPIQSGPSCDIESKTLQLFGRVKAINPQQIRIFYWNSMCESPPRKIAWKLHGSIPTHYIVMYTFIHHSRAAIQHGRLLTLCACACAWVCGCRS